MCGIAGFFGRQSERTSRRTILSMLERIRHRGPDGSGVAVFDEAGLGHVRLAIIDLGGGSQPMTTAKKRHHISYNGELYNYRELREDLQKRGCVFATGSDTEVVLQAFALFGVKALNRFRGMFAFALWDDERKQGWLVRDRFGIKPLYYAENRGRIVFASEIKALFPALSSRPEMDLNSLHLLMNFRYIPGPATMFSGIHHLPAGHYLFWNGERARTGRWTGPLEGLGDEDAVAGLRHRIQQAVDRQLVSDVQVGSYLSGGVDSATLVALANRFKDPSRDLPTFTLRSGDSPYEAVYAGKTAKMLGVGNIQREIDVDLGKVMPWLTYHLEVPKVNGLQSALIAKLAAEHVKVVLSGLGGDEIFLGYNLHRILCALTRVGQWGAQPLARTAGRFAHSIFGRAGLGFEEWARGGKALGTLPDFQKIYALIRNVWDSEDGRRRIYGPKMLAAELDDPFDFLRRHWPEAPDSFSAAALFDMNHKMVNDLLLQEDRLSMAFGLEVRVPFLDEDLVGAASKLDWRRKMAGCRAKRLMREVISAWLPQEVLNRPKSGFQLPIHLFFEKEFRPLADAYLRPDRIEEDGLFNMDFVRQVLAARPKKRLRWHYFILYLMIGVNIWLDVFQEGEAVEAWT